MFSAAGNLVSITTTATATSPNLFITGEELSITDPTGKTSLRITVPSGSSLWNDAMLTALNTTPGTLGAGFVGAGTTGPSTTFEINTNVAGTFTGVVAAQTGHGSGALCTMQIDTSDSSVHSIFVTNPGSGYHKNIATTFTTQETSPVIWRIPATTSSVVGTNSIQAASLNGNMDSGPIEFPTEAGDVLRVMFTITPNAAQKVAGTTDDAVMTYKAHINYVVGSFVNLSEV